MHVPANPPVIYANILYIERKGRNVFSDCLGNTLGPVPKAFGGKIPEYIISGRVPFARLKFHGI